MTPQQIKELAGHRPVPPWVMKLVGEAIAAEREACAKLCEELTFSNAGPMHEARRQRLLCAEAIRARGQE